MKLIIITLNTEVYKQTIGELPDCYIRSCTVKKISDSEEITEVDKANAMSQYWIRNKGTGGYKVNEKLSTNLFNFELV